MKKGLYLFSILFLTGCASHNQGNVNEQYDVDWNTPTFSRQTDSYKYVFSGQIGYRDRGFSSDTLVFPPIPGLVHESVLSFCPVDTCYSEYSVLALRCPEIPALLDWMSHQAKGFADGCSVGDRMTCDTNSCDKDIPFKSFMNAKDICSYYVGELRKIYQNWSCPGNGDHDIANEQAGSLIVDCWKQGPYVTFYKSFWYDWVSCGDNTREYYITVDSETGEELSLNDFVREKDYDLLARELMRRLRSGNGELYENQRTYSQFDHQPTDVDILLEYDSMGLIREGLIITYVPYHLGCGADGSYTAIIPYNKLRGILKERYLPVCK